jgi:hypothetical protein
MLYKSLPLGQHCDCTWAFVFLGSRVRSSFRVDVPEPHSTAFLFLHLHSRCKRIFTNHLVASYLVDSESRPPHSHGVGYLIFSSIVSLPFLLLLLTSSFHPHPSLLSSPLSPTSALHLGLLLDFISLIFLDNLAVLARQSLQPWLDANQKLDLGTRINKMFLVTFLSTRRLTQTQNGTQTLDGLRPPRPTINMSTYLSRR